MNDKVVAISSLALVPLKLEAAPLRRKISAALRRAIAQVKAGKPALVDTVVRPR